MKETTRIQENLYNEYQIVRIIGQGAYGKVYKAKDRKTGEIVAIKRISARGKYEDGIPRTSIRELNILLNLPWHSNIIRVNKVFGFKSKKTKDEAFIYLVSIFLSVDVFFYKK